MDIRAISDIISSQQPLEAESGYGWVRWLVACQLMLLVRSSTTWRGVSRWSFNIWFQESAHLDAARLQSNFPLSALPTPWVCRLPQVRH